MSFSKPENNCQFIGNVGKAPEMRFTPGGSPFTTFSVAINKPIKQDDGTYKYDTTWANLGAFGQLAETIQKRISAGDKVIVWAEYSTTTSEKDGQKRTFHNFTVTSFSVLKKAGDKAAAGSDQDDEAAPAEDFPF